MIEKFKNLRKNKLALILEMVRDKALQMSTFQIISKLLKPFKFKNENFQKYKISREIL